MLVLANIIVPKTTETTFIDSMDNILEDMSHRGNIPARFYRTELKMIRNTASNLIATSFGEIYSFSNQEETISLIQDGKVLSDAILHVIEAQKKALITEDSWDISENMPTANPRSPRRRQPSSAPLQLSQEDSNETRNLTILESSNEIQPNSVYVDGYDAMEDMLTFDTADLQWLDSV